MNNITPTTQSTELAISHEGGIEYAPCSLPFAEKLFPGCPIQTMKAGDTGLAYVACQGDYTIVHIPAKRVLALDWFVDSEQLAQRWIEELVALADWREPVPMIRDAECLNELIHFACVGLLTEGNLGISRISSTVR